MNLVELDQPVGKPGEEWIPKGMKRSKPGFRPVGPGFDGDFFDGMGGYRNQTGPDRQDKMDVGSPSSINASWSKRRMKMPPAPHADGMPNEKMDSDPMEEGQTVHGPGAIDWQSEHDTQVR